MRGSPRGVRSGDITLSDGVWCCSSTTAKGPALRCPSWCGAVCSLLGPCRREVTSGGLDDCTRVRLLVSAAIRLSFRLPLSSSFVQPTGRVVLRSQSNRSALAGCRCQVVMCSRPVNSRVVLRSQSNQSALVVLSTRVDVTIQPREYKLFFFSFFLPMTSQCRSLVFFSYINKNSRAWHHLVRLVKKKQRKCGSFGKKKVTEVVRSGGWGWPGVNHNLTIMLP